MRRFLIIRLSSIGDIVLTTPVIRCLKQQVPDAEVHVLTKASFRSVLQHNPHIDWLHFWDKNYLLLIDQLRQIGFEQVIDLHHNTKTLRIKQALGVPARSFYKLNVEKYLMTAFKINVLPAKHIVDRYLDTVSHLGVVNDGCGLDYFIDAADQLQKQDIPGAQWGGFVAVVIGAALGTKRWPTEHFKSFCSQLEHPIVLLGGKEDQKRGEEIASADPIKIYNACGKFSLNESADWVRRSKFVLTGDTGLMHIAAAFQKPILSLWGNTVPAFGMTPYFGGADIKNIVLEHKVWCRPCSKIGYDRCPIGHFSCMRKIRPEQVLTIARNWLSSSFH
ncbi:MAG: glycosyltransferase family 9 protein [Bacteroidota bacterium]